jgi:hypothetical protein
VPAAARLRQFEGASQRLQDRAAPAAGLDHDVGAPALLDFRHLAAADVRELRARHAGPFQHPVRLHDARCRHQDRQVAAPIEPGLEQERHVEHGDAHVIARAALEEPVAFLRDQRMQDPLQPAERRRIAEDLAAQRLAVDPVRPGDTGKGRLDRRQRPAARPHQPVDRRVRIIDPAAEPTQHAGRRALAHADRSGEAEDDHRAIASSTAARSAPSTAGASGGSNQAWKPGTAWCSSMPSPSTVGLPRARARPSRSVSSGL